MGWIEDQTKDGKPTPGSIFEHNGVKYYTRTDDDGGDKGQIQVWTVDGNRHLGTFPKDKTKPFEKNVNIFDYNPVTDEEIKDIRNDPKFSAATRAASKATVITVTRKACMDKKNADGSSNSTADCQAKAEATSDKVALNDKQLKAKEKAKQDEKTAIDQAKQNAENLKNFNENAQQRKDSYNDLIYPEALDTKKQDFVMFSLVEYVPRGVKSNGGGQLSSRPVPAGSNKKAMMKGNTVAGVGGQRKILGTAVLPIPAGIQDQNNMNWGEDQMDPMKGLTADVANTFLSDGNVGQVAEDAVDTAAKHEEGAKNALVSVLSGVSGIKREMGAVVNQNTELLFGGPKLRSFNFTFRLSPRSAAEAKSVKQIIRFFKQGASAKKGNDFMFIKAPHTFFINYYEAGGESHPWLNSFKECALSGVSVQYTPDGQYSTFPDGAMTSYSLQLNFKELEPVFDSDYTDLDGDKDSSIGY